MSAQCAVPSLGRIALLRSALLQQPLLDLRREGGVKVLEQDGGMEASVLCLCVYVCV